jgi:hypothetical protein
LGYAKAGVSKGWVRQGFRYVRLGLGKGLFRQGLSLETVGLRKGFCNAKVGIGKSWLR